MNFRIAVILLIASITATVAQPQDASAEVAQLRSEVKRLSNQVDLLTQLVAKLMASKEASPMVPADTTALAPALVPAPRSQPTLQRPPSTTRVMPGAVAPRPARESVSGRCQATTKAGSQCKRNAAAGSSYCWQHG